MKKIILVSMLLCLSNLNATSYLEKKVYSVSSNEIPHYKEIVNQNLVKKIPSYRGGWYFCAQASWATAFNILRGTRNANKVNQLNYFHQKLLRYSQYRNNNPHMEGNGDLLTKITNSRKDFKSIKKTTTNRTSIKKELNKALVSSKIQIPIVLSQIVINGKKYGHFYVVYKVDRIKERVYYADPYRGRIGSMSYTNFLNSMRDAGTKGRYSFWIIRKL